MNASAISNILSTPTVQKNGAPVSGNGEDSGAFNQVLTREMAAQGQSSDTRKDQNATNTGNAAQTGNASSTGTTTNEATASTNQSGASETPEETAVDPSSAAELAAFVAILTQANPAAAAPEAEDAALSGKRIAIDHDAPVAVADDLAADDVPAGKGKDNAGKGIDFAAVMEKAGNTKPDGEQTVSRALKTTDLGATPQHIAANATAALRQSAEAEAQQQNRLAPQVGSQNWNQALGQKVVWMVQGLQQTATLTLNPPDLGPLQVTVNVQNNQANASFTAAQPEVRHALEAALPRLREMLNDAGIQLGESSVSAGSSNQQGNNAFADAQRPTGNGRQATTGNDAETTIVQVPPSSRGTGMVDTFA